MFTLTLVQRDGGDEIDDGGEALVGLRSAWQCVERLLCCRRSPRRDAATCIFLGHARHIRWFPRGAEYGLHVVGTQSFAQPAGIKSLVADQGQAVDAGHESVKAGDVVPLARQEHEADQIAERIYDDRDLRRQAAARFADGLILSPPFAPVPC